MAKISKVEREPEREYSENTWCIKNGCHCDYLAGISPIKCEDCEQEPKTTEFVIIN